MDSAKNNKSLMLGIPGIVIQLFSIAGVGMVADSLSVSPALTTLAVIGVWAIGTVLLIAGLSYYAQAKNQSGWWGLIGLLGLIGLIVLSALPDNHARVAKLASITNRIEDLPTAGSAEFRCMTCGYQLNGTVGYACPECGRPFNPDDLRTVTVVGLDAMKAPWMGRWSLICGVLALLLSFAFTCGPILSLLGVVFGHVALVTIKKQRRPGFGIALTGLIFSYGALVISFLFVALLVVG